jgi:hypothetical protein
MIGWLWPTTDTSIRSLLIFQRTADNDELELALWTLAAVRSFSPAIWFCDLCTDALDLETPDKGFPNWQCWAEVVASTSVFQLVSCGS